MSQHAPIEPVLPDWSHPATIRPRDADGILADMTDLNHGTFAEMVLMASRFHAEERARLVVQVTGGPRYGVHEFMALRKRPDFPLS